MMITVKDLYNLKAFYKEDMEWYDVLTIRFEPGGIFVSLTGHNPTHIKDGWVTCWEGYSHECQVDLFYVTESGELEQVL